VLEVDEGHLPRAIAETRPIAAVLLNLSRDQLDRVGEVRRHADRWREALSKSPGTTVVANADDPLVVWAAQGASEILWVGTHHGWRSDATSCPACAGHIEWDTGGIWACDSCAFRRPLVDACLTDAGLVIDHFCHPFDLALPGWANRANAAMAAMAGSAFGVSIDQALESMRTTTGVEGRYERVEIGGIEVRLLLAKNPAGWNELFEVLSPAPAPLVVGINSRVVDGRDPSWLWDVPFERLRGRQVVATGERGRDLSVRLRYADVPHTFVADISQAVAAAGADGQAIDLAANYSCFQQARQVAT
jgi:UDP-N-acetylmuramyl tripeptide synthase